MRVGQQGGIEKMLRIDPAARSEELAAARSNLRHQDKQQSTYFASFADPHQDTAVKLLVLVGIAVFCVAVYFLGRVLLRLLLPSVDDNQMAMCGAAGEEGRRERAQVAPAHGGHYIDSGMTISVFICSLSRLGA